MLNRYLMELSWEQGNTLYGLLGNLQWPAYVLLLLWVSWKFPISAKKKVFLWLIFFVARFWSAELCPLLYEVTNGFFPRINLGVAFLFFLVIAAALAYMLKVPVLLSLDTLIPPFILGRGLAITGCIFTGCCQGYPVAWGIYSRASETTTFPTVILDIVFSCLIAGYLLYLNCKHKYSGNGIAAAVGMATFGVLRLAIDILRDNGSVVTIEGIFGLICGVAGLFLFRKIRQITKAEKVENHDI